MTQLILRARRAMAHAFSFPLVRLGLLGAALGAVAFVLLGTTPRSLGSEGKAASEWALQPMPTADLASAQAALQATPFWSSQPASVLPEAGSAAVPLPKLIGVISDGGTVMAVFELSDGRRVRAGQDQVLETGERIQQIEPTRVRFTDSTGASQEVRLLDQLQKRTP